MEQFINILFISKDTALFNVFKQSMRDVDNFTFNLIFAKTADESINIVSQKHIGILVIDCLHEECSQEQTIHTLLERSKSNQLLTLLLTNKPEAFYYFVFKIKKGICDVLPLPLNTMILNTKLEIFRRVFFNQLRLTQILSNVFSPAIIEEYRRKGRIEPKRYQNAVILFTDFVKFSAKSAHMEPMEIIKKLEKYFSKFDDICERYKIEKIKTIGDAYMAIAGVMDNYPEPEIRVCLAANEMMHFVRDEFELAEAQGEEGWQIRIGINGGTIVGGIIGKKKLLYDVWGDAVNIAARAEESSDSGRIMISECIYKHIAPYFDAEFHDDVEIKKRGGKVSMYFLNKLKPSNTIDYWGIYPTNALLEKCGLYTMDFFRMRENIIYTLRCSLPNEMYYHSIERCVEIDSLVKRYGKIEALPHKDILILRTAALYHDVGFIVNYEHNEQYAVMMAQNNLPKYGYTEEDIRQVCALIWVTSREEGPKNLMEQLICDANSDYLGRVDYPIVANKLRKELAHYQEEMSDRNWLDYQIDYLEYKHRYYSDLVKNLRNRGKTKQIEELKRQRNELVERASD